MKKIILVLCALVAGKIVSAQDIIILNNEAAEEMKVKVVEVTEDIVKYKKWSYQSGPTFSISTQKIFVIKYQNGEKQRFIEEQQPQQPVAQPAPQQVVAPAPVYQPAEVQHVAAPETTYQPSQQNVPVQEPAYQTANNPRETAFTAPAKKRAARPQKSAAPYVSENKFKPGFETNFGASFLLSLDDYVDHGLMFDLSMGWRFNRHLYLGGDVSYVGGNGFDMVGVMPHFRVYCPIAGWLGFYGDVAGGVAIGVGDASGTEAMYRVGPGLSFGKSDPATLSAQYIGVGEAGFLAITLGWSMAF